MVDPVSLNPQELRALVIKQERQLHSARARLARARLELARERSHRREVERHLVLEQKRRRQAENERDHDELTGCLTRRAFDKAATQRIRRARRYGRPSGIVFFDADGFKRVNDRLGHDAGDLFLALLGQRIREDLQTTELIGRKGGDEFWILLSTGDRPYANFTVRRIGSILADIRREFIALYGEEAMQGIPLTVSAGTCVSKRFSLSKMCAIADERMYKNKEKKKRERA
ncbi:diguanylate cyclase [Patescibacteria group bacterium]|jgi:diguanylate cyclase (GGDEF)-like protein|nr:diguanylate cyclase [Patescibacteria group bacterium]